MIFSNLDKVRFLRKEESNKSFYLQWEWTSSINKLSFSYSRFCILWLQDNLMILVKTSMQRDNAVVWFVNNWYCDIIRLMTLRATKTKICWKIDFRKWAEYRSFASSRAIVWSWI
jgi:hypothetical protein